MKRLVTTILLIGLLSGLELNAQVTYTRDSVSMTPGYASDVYYSMSQGEAAASARDTWDIAFRAYPYSASILVNDISGAELYTWPNGAIADWANVDTNGLSTWPQMYNSPSEWEEGAFTRNENGQSDDYGWGTYNTVTHNIMGDSIFVIRTVAGSLKKLAIVSKQSLAMIYTIHYANLDGTADTTVDVDASVYADKNFIYYNLDSDSLVDREPLKDDWDIVFTKYYDEVMSSMYPVTGVLQNYNVMSAKYTMGDTASLFWELDSLKEDRNTIGYDWKVFSMSTFQYEVDDSMYFFVMDINGDLYKLVFESFAGSSTGDLSFRKALVSPAGLDEGNVEGRIRIYPNPASDEVTLQLPESLEGASISVFNSNGQKVIGMVAESLELRLSAANLVSGIYVVEVTSGNLRAVSRLMVR